MAFSVMMMEGPVGCDLPSSGFTVVCSQTADSEEGGQVALKVGIRCVMVVRVLVLVLCKLLILIPDAGAIRELCFSRLRSLHVRRCQLHID